MIRSLWDSIWPNTVAPSAWTILAVVVSHIRAARQRQRHHEDMKQHVTAATGATMAKSERTIECPACGQDVATSAEDIVAEHDTPGGSACVAAGWTVKGERR